MERRREQRKEGRKKSLSLSCIDVVGNSLETEGIYLAGRSYSFLSVMKKIGGGGEREGGGGVPVKILAWMQRRLTSE
jgi:hypothetical protein